MGRNVPWPEKDIKTLIEMWAEGSTTKEIAKKLNKTPEGVRSYVSRNREKLNLETRPSNFIVMSRSPEVESDFEKAWKGPIPRGHWLMTKSWGSAK